MWNILRITGGNLVKISRTRPMIGPSVITGAKAAGKVLRHPFWSDLDNKKA